MYTHTQRSLIWANSLETIFPLFNLVWFKSDRVLMGRHRRPSDLQIFHTHGIVLCRNFPTVLSLLMTLQLFSISISIFFFAILGILFHLLSIWDLFSPTVFRPFLARCAACIMRRPVRWTAPMWPGPSEIASAASAGRTR